MTITSGVTTATYSSNGVTTSFSIPFKFFTSDDITILHTPTDGDEVELTSGFTITGGAGSTGTVTFSSAPAAGTLEIRRDTELTQESAYTNAGKFPAQSHEKALDKLTMIVQDLTRNNLETLARVAQAENDIDVLDTDGFLGNFALPSRAVAENTTVPSDVDKISVLVGGVYYDFVRDVSGTALSTNSGSVNWSPSGTPALAHFNGSTSLLQAYIDGLSAKRGGLIDGLYDITAPIQSTAKRSQTLHGATDMSNVVQPGSQIRYRNTAGKNVVCTSATAASPAVFTKASHGLVDGDVVWASAVSGGTWQAAISGGPWTVANKTTDTFQLEDAAGTAFDGTGLGSLSSVTFKDAAEIAGLHLVGPYMHSYKGLVLRARDTPDAIVKLTANQNLGSSNDFSGTLTRFDGVQTVPYVDDVGDAGIIVENNKFVTITHSWLQAGADNKPVLRVGTYASAQPNTYMTGTAGGMVIDQTYVLGDIVLTNGLSIDIRATQFDATTIAARIRPPSDGLQSPITGFHMQSSGFYNDGGADAEANAALEQPSESYASNSVLPTSGWHLVSNLFRDWPFAVHLKSGWAALKANVFRAHNSSSVAVIIGANVVGDSIDHTNYFLNHARTGAIGIRDDRYASHNVTGATQANPVVITAVAHGYANGDRVRLSSIGGMSEIDNREFIVQGATTDTFQLYSLTDAGGTSAAVDGTGYTAYTSGGTVKRPYMWHKQSIGGTVLSLGHGPMVFDLALDDTHAINVGTTSLLTMANVPLTGGRYRFSLGGTIDMQSATGLVSFTWLINGAVVAEADHSFDHQGSANTEIAVNFSKIIPLAAYQSTSGTSIILRITVPGTVNVRGRRAGTLGQTFGQIERVA